MADRKSNRDLFPVDLETLTESLRLLEAKDERVHSQPWKIAAVKAQIALRKKGASDDDVRKVYTDARPKRAQKEPKRSKAVAAAQPAGQPRGGAQRGRGERRGGRGGARGGGNAGQVRGRQENRDQAPGSRANSQKRSNSQKKKKRGKSQQPRGPTPNDIEFGMQIGRLQTENEYLKKQMRMRAPLPPVPRAKSKRGSRSLPLPPTPSKGLRERKDRTPRVRTPEEEKAAEAYRTAAAAVKEIAARLKAESNADKIKTIEAEWAIAVAARDAVRIQQQLIKRGLKRSKVNAAVAVTDSKVATTVMNQTVAVADAAPTKGMSERSLSNDYW